MYIIYCNFFTMQNYGTTLETFGINHNLGLIQS